MRTIEIIPYQLRWTLEFRTIGTSLRKALGPLALRIDHIGSTSVPGLGAKDIVDVQVTVSSLFPENTLSEAFMAAGYPMRLDVSEDHRPAHNDEPITDWQKRYCRESPGSRRAHIHVRAAGAANQRYALLFRDYLKSNRSCAGSYERIKCELARLHPHDIDAYLAVKDPACDLIISAAELWAATTHWEPGPSDA